VASLPPDIFGETEQLRDMSNPVILIKLKNGEYVKINRDDILFIAHGTDDGSLHLGVILFDNNSLTAIISEQQMWHDIQEKDIDDIDRTSR